MSEEEMYMHRQVSFVTKSIHAWVWEEVWEWAYARTPNLMPRRHMAAGMSMYKGNRSMWVFSWRQSHFDCSLYDHTALLWITFFFWFAKRYPLSVNAIGSRFCLLQAHISTGVGKPLRGIKYPLTKSFIESLHVENQKLGRRLIVLPSHEDWKADSTQGTYTHRIWSCVFANRSSGISVSWLSSRFLWT